MNEYNKNEEGKVIETGFVLVDDNSAKDKYKSYVRDEDVKKQNKGKRGMLSYIAVGLICAVLGGATSGAAVLYGVPNSKIFSQTPLYKSINQAQKSASQTNTNTPATVVQLASGEGGMSIVDIAKKVGPAVVGVSTKSRSQSGFYGIPSVQEGMGSGIIFSEDGYILTNNHVIQGAQQIKVIFNNNKEVNAKVINYDADMDIAVIKVTDKVDMPAVAEFGDSNSLQAGELAVAIGNPLGKDLLGSVTAGIISANNRDITIGKQKMSLIQTDAAINPGNSGGALVNSKGQVIGINTIKMSASGIEGLGFAIPINEIKPRIESLSKPQLKIGFSGVEIDKEKAQQYDLPIGVYVKDIENFSPAEKAGLQNGDVITKFGDEKIATVSDINKIKGKYKNGDTVKMEVIRDGKSKTLSIKLSDK